MASLKKKTRIEVQGISILRKVMPAVPMDMLEYGALTNNLNRMECARLFNLPWGFQEEYMVKDLMGTLS